MTVQLSPNAPKSDRIAALLAAMDDRGASDLFVTVGRPPALRIAGEVVSLPQPPVTREEFEAFIDSYVPEPSAERFRAVHDADVSLSLDDKRRFRLNFYSERGRPALAARRVPAGTLAFDALHLPPSVKKMADAPRGLILITGSTGSGKSTTMAAMIHHINTHYRRHIVTIEDPIEFVHADVKSVVSQREIGMDTESFRTALRHALRQNPDVLVIGEMRDRETIETAVSAALTGHLVVTTFHTGSVVQTLERIVNYYPAHLRDQVAQHLSVAITGIVSQRLVPRADGEGRIPAVEVLVATPLARRLIAERQFEDIGEVIKAGEADGMQTFTQALTKLYRQNLITVDAGRVAATNPEEFLLAVAGMETGVDSLRGTAKEDGGVPQGYTMDSLLRTAVRSGASDLLISTGVPPMLRINGELFEVSGGPLTPEDTRRLLFSLLSPSRRARFEAEREIDFALSFETDQEGKEDESRHIRRRFRVNGFFQKGNISCALRVIPDRIPTAEELGLPRALLRAAERMHGLILVTGPTGHGKTTTLACLIDRINGTRPCHIITVEDPIEYVHTSKAALVEQREVHADTLSFHNALKYVLRQDPDVIMIGEMRDHETIAAALTAAETGHLVLATLHTNDAVQTIDRIIDVFPPHQQAQIRTQLAGALIGIFAQRLLPRKDGKGRIAVFEVLLANTAVRALIREQRTHQIPSVMETCAREGMITFEHALRNLYEQDMITRDTMRALLGEIGETPMTQRRGGY